MRYYLHAFKLDGQQGGNYRTHYRHVFRSKSSIRSGVLAIGYNGRIDGRFNAVYTLLSIEINLKT